MPRRYRLGLLALVSVGLLTATTAGAVSSGRPSAPRAVHARANAGAARVSWSAPSSLATTGVRTYVVTSSPGHKSCTTTALSCTVFGLAKGTPYTFTVVAKNRWGSSTTSPTSNVVEVVAANGTPVSSIG